MKGNNYLNSVHTALKFAIGIFIFVLLSMSFSFIYNTISINCIETIGVITSIKSVSVGGIFTSDKCIYETTEGDAINYCYYEIGDKIEVSSGC